MTKDLNQLASANYDPLYSKIKTDIHRWNLIPFLSLSSRINTIKMNILPRLQYIFRTLPVEVNDSCFKEWDKLISRFIWQGKRPRIRYNILQLGKERGGMALPCLRKYFLASQLIPLLYWCNPNYKANWKIIELNQNVSFPLQAAIADRSLSRQLEELNNPWINLKLKIWQKVVKYSEIHNMLKPFRWCAYDSDFLPNRKDKTFESWTKKGLTTYLSFTEKNVLDSFQHLQNKHGLEKNDFFRYLQLRDYFNHHCKPTDLTKAESEVHKILKAAGESFPRKSIPKLYNVLLYGKNENTLHIKEKWEKEAILEPSEEAWEEIWSFQWSSTSSMIWREHC